MTHHNLDVHLSWLLHTKPSIPPPTTSLPAASASFSPVRPSQNVSSGSSTAQDLFAPIVQGNTGGEAVRAVRAPEEEMARLRTAPGSSSKPSLVSMGPRISTAPARVGPPVASTAVPISLKSVLGTAGAIRTPSRPAPDGFRLPNDLETMDLTESMSVLGSPTPKQDGVPRSSRKRKSDELESELARPAGSHHAVREVARRVPTQPEPRLSQGFTAIDDLMEESFGPPPPYSTVPPTVTSLGTRLPSVAARNLPSSTTLSGEHDRVMPDSDADSEDDIIDFTGSKHRRSEARSTPPSKRRALTRQKTLAAIADSSSVPCSKMMPPADSAPHFVGDDHKGASAGAARLATSNVAMPTDDLAPLGAQRLPAEAPTTTPTTSAPEVASEDTALLRKLFAASDSEIQLMFDELNAREERLCDDIAQRLDEGDEAEELDNELEALHGTIKMAKELLSRRSDYRLLTAEKEQLFAAMRHAVKSKSGRDDARAANNACKARLQSLEASCVNMLQSCKQGIAPFLARLAQPNDSVQSKAVAVQSTQARPIRTAVESAVPSSSRIAQTQMMPPPAPRDQRITPGNIEAYFSPKRKHQAAPPPMHRTPKHQRSVAFDDTMHDDLNDEDVFAANDDLFSNRMGTPPAPYDYNDDEDYGIGDDDMLEVAADSENRGPIPHTARDSSHRPVFVETSGNSQIQHQVPSAKKSKRLGATQADADIEAQFRFRWSDDVKVALRERFRLKGFRENQLQAINATLAGKDTFILMPTGGGKSLCYQLPSLISTGQTKGVTVVVSPLLSLMEDQVQHLRKLNIQAFLINGDTSPAEKKHIREVLGERNAQEYIQLLYVTPEMLSKNQSMIATFEALHRRQQLARLVIDEAHCVSQWGHDFRPDYKLLGDVRKRFPGVPVMALTATATENVKVDIMHNLGMDGCDRFTRSFNRPNLYYEVRQKGAKGKDVETIAELIKENHRGQTGIIYCLSRKNCEDMATALRTQHKIKAEHYHAGLGPEEKSQIQKKWQAGKYHVIVATIAFGMGIDKADVRFVIHHSIPKSLEGYYQETGRAGRDGKESGCYLFYGYGDYGKLRRMIDDGEGSWEQKERQRQMLQKMVQYCENKSDCRRVQVLAYFNEVFRRDQCDSQCDNCNSSARFETQDFTEYAEKAVSLVRQVAPDNVTLLHCIDVFRGSANKKAKDKGHNSLDEFGAGRDLDRENVERLFYRLLSEDAIRENNVLNKSGFANQYVALGRKSRNFESGRQKISLQVRITPAKARAPAKKSKKAKQDVGCKDTAGSRMPLSTNVSSPVQAASKRKTTRQPLGDPLHANGYKHDNFMTSDPEDDEYAEDDDKDKSEGFESIGFAPIREKGRPRGEKRRDPGPRILLDDVMDSLDEYHRDTVEAFVAEAKQKCTDLIVQRGLRTAPFSDTILRQMAINFTETPERMMLIPGIEPEKVMLFGRQFCKLVTNCKREYDAIVGQGDDDRPVDPNAQNVIDLVSDEEEEDDYGSLGTSDLDDDEPGEPSTYFQPSERVQQFNEKFAYSQSEALRTKPTKAAANKGTKRFRGKPNYQPKARQASESAGGFRSGSGVAKRKETSRRSKGSGSGSNDGPRTAKAASSRRGGIFMMPT